MGSFFKVCDVKGNVFEFFGLVFIILFYKYDKVVIGFFICFFELVEFMWVRDVR